MDMKAYCDWERYGTNTDAKDQPLKAVRAKALPHLTDAERELYECLGDESWTRYRQWSRSASRCGRTCSDHVPAKVSRLGEGHVQRRCPQVRVRAP